MNPAEATWSENTEVAPGAAFEVFFRENYPRVERFLWSLCPDRHLVDDAVQEAFIVAYAKWDVVSRHQRPLIWVRKVARNKLWHLQAQNGRHREAPLDDIVPDRLTEPADPYEARQTILYLLRRLPRRQREVLALEMDGSTDAEIALELDITENTVRTYKAEARRRFQELAADADYQEAARRRR
ncbi:sigma-70 family RNA polymerase sigma factor [Actinoplanes sichuanensis]|uniref:RNA polymerase sigma factor n=1 Tax=Actinoplanes sichuanensis TaxID=512349 RepID=A0ABW4AIY2_9ACTN|nr:sigma-70 family RNA polymerase sigma factor [Actinoplanes sichuanensis]BEL12111.1 sigma-70 family RNA polymerase sigma factor [Actinoplanes sichuanensis]